MKARVKTSPTPVLDKILRGSERAEILIALAHGIVLMVLVLVLGHEYGDLSAEFCEFKGACRK